MILFEVLRAASVDVNVNIIRWKRFISSPQNCIKKKKTFWGQNGKRQKQKCTHGALWPLTSLLYFFKTDCKHDLSSLQPLVPEPPPWKLQFLCTHQFYPVQSLPHLTSRQRPLPPPAPPHSHQSFSSDKPLHCRRDRGTCELRLPLQGLRAYYDFSAGGLQGKRKQHVYHVTQSGKFMQMHPLVV